MGRSRISDQERSLTGSHPERARAYPVKHPLAKRVELESIFSDLLERRAACMADLKASGFVTTQERCVRGQLYRSLMMNPSLKICQQTEKQIVELAKVFIVADAAESEPGRKSDQQLIDEIDEMIRKAN